MRHLLLLILAVFILTLPSTVSAKPHYHHNWSHSAYHNNTWHQTHYESLPFKWHEKHNRFVQSQYRMERIHDPEWTDKFPDLHSYRWHDNHDVGFWYQGHRIVDAVLFYNHSDELVSVGFIHNGVFLFIRDDQSSYENHDSFFFSWWH